jgi:hypothetical protein
MLTRSSRDCQSVLGSSRCVGTRAGDGRFETAALPRPLPHAGGVSCSLALGGSDRAMLTRPRRDWSRDAHSLSAGLPVCARELAVRWDACWGWSLRDRRPPPAPPARGRGVLLTRSRRVWSRDAHSLSARRVAGCSLALRGIARVMLTRSRRVWSRDALSLSADCTRDAHSLSAGLVARCSLALSRLPRDAPVSVSRTCAGGGARVSRTCAGGGARSSRLCAGAARR